MIVDTPEGPREISNFDDMIDQTEALFISKVSLSKFIRMQKRQLAPQPIKKGGASFYIRRDIQEWSDALSVLRAKRNVERLYREFKKTKGKSRISSGTIISRDHAWHKSFKSLSVYGKYVVLILFGETLPQTAVGPYGQKKDALEQAFDTIIEQTNTGPYDRRLMYVSEEKRYRGDAKQYGEDRLREQQRSSDIQNIKAMKGFIGQRVLAGMYSLSLEEIRAIQAGEITN